MIVLLFLTLFIITYILCYSFEMKYNITEFFHPEIERYYNVIYNKYNNNKQDTNLFFALDNLYKKNKYLINEYKNVTDLYTKTYYIEQDKKLQTIFNYIDNIF